MANSKHSSLYYNKQSINCGRNIIGLYLVNPRNALKMLELNSGFLSCKQTVMVVVCEFSNHSLED
jgi:hypothetical protein